MMANWPIRPLIPPTARSAGSARSPSSRRRSVRTRRVARSGAPRRPSHRPVWAKANHDSGISSIASRGVPLASAATAAVTLPQSIATTQPTAAATTPSRGGRRSPGSAAIWSGSATGPAYVAGDRAPKRLHVRGATVAGRQVRPRSLSGMRRQPPPPPPPPPSPGRSRGPGPGGRDGQSPMPRWAIWVLAGALVAMFLLPSLFSTDDRTKIPYSDLREKVAAGQVEEITWSNDGGDIDGTLTDGTEFTSNGPVEPPEEDLALFRDHDVEVEFSNPQPSILDSLLPILLPIAFFIGIFWLLQRRAQSQMGSIMSIGRSK